MKNTPTTVLKIYTQGNRPLAASLFCSMVSHQIVRPAATSMIKKKKYSNKVCPFGKFGFLLENIASCNTYPITKQTKPIVIYTKENPLGQHPNDLLSLLFSFLIFLCFYSSFYVSIRRCCSSSSGASSLFSLLFLSPS